VRSVPKLLVPARQRPAYWLVALQVVVADGDLTIREAPQRDLQLLVDRVDEELVAGSLALQGQDEGVA
jgi:hypothetical protein